MAGLLLSFIGPLVLAAVVLLALRWRARRLHEHFERCQRAEADRRAKGV